MITLSGSVVQGAFSGRGWIGGSYVDGGGNVDNDPMFVTPVDPSTALTTLGNLRLKINSPAINARNNGHVSVLFDPDSNERIVAGKVDMRAYEDQNGYPFENYSPLIIW